MQCNPSPLDDLDRDPRPRRYAEQGRKLKEARKGTGLSQVNFAERVWVTHRHLIRLENGEHRPGKYILAGIERETGETAKSLGYEDDSDA